MLVMLWSCWYLLNTSAFYNNNNNNDNNNNNNNNNNNFGPGGEPPSLPSIEDFLDRGPRLPQPPPPPPPSINGNLFNTPNVFIPPPPTDDCNINVNKAPPTIWKKGIGNNLFGSQAMMKGPREIEKTETQNDIDDFLYELPEKECLNLKSVTDF